MIQVIRSFHALGLRMGDLLTSTLRSYYTWEITAEAPSFVYCEEPLSVPLTRPRSSNQVPNRLYDTIQYLLPCLTHTKAGKKPKSALFWERFLLDLEKNGDPELVRAAQKAQARVQKWHVQYLTAPKAGKDSRAFRVVQHPTPDLDLDAGKVRKMPGAMKEGVWVVPTYKGTPVVSLPAFRAWWETEFDAAIRDPFPGGQSDVDLITGETCIPNRTHRMIKGFHGIQKAALASYNKDVHRFQGLEKGANFPAAAMTIHRYVSAAEYLLEPTRGNSKAGFLNNLTLLFWPDAGALTHPLITLALQVLGGKNDAQEAAWSQIAALPPDDVVLHAALFQGQGGSKGRVALLQHTTLSSAKLRENLLRFSVEFGKRYSLRTLLSTTTEKSRESDPIIPEALVPHVVWAVVTAEPFPAAVAAAVFHTGLGNKDLAVGYKRRFIETWIHACNRRKKGLPPMPLEDEYDNILGKLYTMTTEELSQIRPPDQEAFFASLPRTHGSYYGRGLQCFAAIKKAIHWKNPKAVRPQDILQAGLASPRAWLGGKEPQDAQVYMDKAMRNGWYNRLQEAMFKEMMHKLGSWRPCIPNAEERADIIAGWYCQQRFNEICDVYWRVQRRLREMRAAENAAAAANAAANAADPV